MRRLALPLLLLSFMAGCVVRTVVAQPVPPPEAQPAPMPVAAPLPPPAPPLATYFGEHALPGGGWCYVVGAHEHEFFPTYPEHYVVENGYYLWRGPLAITFYAGHPLPGRGWCSRAGPHVHDYFPPRSDHWMWTPGRGYLYRGPYSAARLPPQHYWVRPAPAPRYQAPIAPARHVHAPAPAPVYGHPAPPMQVAPAPGHPAPPMQAAPAPAHPAPPIQAAPAPFPGRAQPAPVMATPVAGRPMPGASAAAPGHGSVPSGHAGLPPGQVMKNDPSRQVSAANPSSPARPVETRGPKPAPRANGKEKKAEGKDDDGGRKHAAR